MQTQCSPEELLEAFRALGGSAENVRLDESGGGLIPRDPERAVLLRVPESLLFPPEAFEFVDGLLRLGDGEHASQPLRDFFAHYGRVVGRTLQQRSAAHIAAFDALPPPVKDFLGAEFGMRESFQGDIAGRIENQFVDRRTYWRGEQRIIVPVLELADHDPAGLAIQDDGGIRIAGPAPDRIRIFHPLQDPIAIFRRFGFAAAQPVAFSLPLRIVSDGIEISIGRNLHLADRRGTVAMPQFNVVARNSLTLSHVMIGHSRFPRLPRSIFCARMRDADVKEPGAQYDRIVQQNTAKLLKLLDLLKDDEGPTLHSLRTVARHQLEALSWSIGSSEI